MFCFCCAVLRCSEVTLTTFCDYACSEGVRVWVHLFLCWLHLCLVIVYPSSLLVLKADAQLPSAHCQSGRRAGVLAVRRRYQLLGALTATIECHLFQQSCQENECPFPRAASENAVPVYRRDARSAHFVVSFLSITTTTKHTMPGQPSKPQKSIATSTKRKQNSFDLRQRRIREQSTS